MSRKKLLFNLLGCFLLIPAYLPLSSGYSAKIVFYYGPTYSDHLSYDLHNVASILKHPKFIHKRTDLYMHGYRGFQESYSVHLMVESYLRGNSINFLAIDWKVLSSGSYLSAQQNLLKLAPRIADSILQLFAAGLDCESFGLVGHSMGAIGVGLIGRNVRSRSNGTVQLARVTSLDPANPAAHAVFILPHVAKTDAKFVAVIHTDAGGRGCPRRMGHADFWPNGGISIQPGCPPREVNLLCSHLKAYAYWAQSVANVRQRQLLAYRAQSYGDFLRTGAGNLRDTAVLMGVNCPADASGDYYLQLTSNYGSIPIIGLGI